jgi:hypothetical protein
MVQSNICSQSIMAHGSVTCCQLQSNVMMHRKLLGSIFLLIFYLLSIYVLCYDQLIDVVTPLVDTLLFVFL